MIKIYTIIVSTFFLVQQTMAMNSPDIKMTSEDNACKSLAQTCLAAGYIREPGKQVWENCMKPVLLGQKVPSVNINPAIVQICRAAKIAQLKQDLQDLQSVKVHAQPN